MSASFFISKVDHCRAAPSVHRFTYHALSVLLDLEEWGKPDSLLSFDRFGLFSLSKKDYLFKKTGSVRERLESYLAEWGESKQWSRVELLSSPRFLGYVFNPVNFYLCYGQYPEEVELCVAEVNNTFGETHLYIGVADEANSTRRVPRFRAAKAFHVSPFYDRQGTYEFFIERGQSMIDVRVNLCREGKTTFTSGIAGTLSRPESKLRAALWGLRHSWFTYPRIVAQAGVLYFQKKLPVYSKPVANSKWTINRRPPAWRERKACSLVLRYLSQMKKGRLLLTLPSGEEKAFGESVEGRAPARLTVYDWSFFSRLLWGGDIALGETHSDNIWASEDLTAVLLFFAENMEDFDDRKIPWTKFSRFVKALRHRLRGNSKAGSKRNIPAHYDLGNELFSRFLDERLVYSCGLYNSAEDSLEQAQLNKLREMIRKADIRAEHHVLEIGGGWGAFAVEAAKTVACRVTAITLSKEQFAAAKARAKAEGVEDKVEVLLCDYRDVQGSYDRIVSIEMLEAVGHEHLGVFFKNCNRLLKRDGLLALQFITVPDHKYEAYRRNSDWIQEYIFPGGLCPSISAVCTAAAKNSELVVEKIENIGPHYARTLKEWRERFKASSPELLKLGYDERFQRMWEYYLCYCEAGFAARYLGTVQIVMSRPHNLSLGQCPGYSL